MSRSIVVGLLLLLSFNGRSQVVSPGERQLINADWRFQKGDPSGTGDTLSYDKIKGAVMASAAGFLQNGKNSNSVPAGLGQNVSCSQPAFDDSSWRKLNLPHDWGIEGPFDPKLPGGTGKLPWSGVAWYRKHIALPAADAGKQIYLDIDGAMAYATVWCNGQFVGGWPYGYSSFRLDLTHQLKPGSDNVIAIRLDNPKNSSRWYPGGGIYRNVWLVKQSAVHVAHWGTYVTTPKVSSTRARISLRTSIENDSSEPAEVVVKTTVLLGGKCVFSFPKAARNIAAGETRTIEAVQSLKNPQLWSLENPTMYSALTTVSVGDKIVDSYETPFGVRSIQFTPDNGFLLNGHRVYIKGVCDHHDLGALGTAINVRALERQIELLQEMGCNAIRTSHNPPAPELLDLCDRKGMLVMDEGFDAWRVPKVPNGYNRLFDDWSERDLKAQIFRDRNHPSVILWSIGNEVYDQGKPAAAKLAKKLTAYAHSADPTRPTTHASDHIESGYNGFQDGIDVFGYNYKPGEYARFHATHPEQPIFGSETASTYSSRGYYSFTNDNVKFQANSYDLDAGGWATTPDREFEGQDRNPFVAGEFVWTGFDYFGEPTPFDTGVARSSYFGIYDMCGFRKDRFYLYQSRWRPDLPMAHIMPHWNWPERVGQIIPVQVYTSGDAAELFLNGKSLGLKKKGAFQYRLRWDEVVYEPGVLKVVAYKNGTKWATDTVKTAGPAAKLTLQADRNLIRADGLDLSFITVTVADKNGLSVPRSHNHIQFTIEGPGEIVATDNGDPTSYESFQKPEHDAFNGLALVVVRSKSGQPGNIKLIAKSQGLDEASLDIVSHAGDRGVLSILGSSVAHGSGSSGNKNNQFINGSYANGYAADLTVAQATNGWCVVNQSVGGDTTSAVKKRFYRDEVPVHADEVLIGLSLGNEGLAKARNPQSVFNHFFMGITNLIAMSRSNNILPLVADQYPKDNYSSNEYVYLKKMDLLLNTLDVPSVNFLGATDDGFGHWVNNSFINLGSGDGTHPNDAGYYEMFLSIVPSLFDAVKEGKPTPHWGNRAKYLRITADPRLAAPLGFTPGLLMHSFTLSFRVRSATTGTIASIILPDSSVNPAIEITPGGVAYVGTNGTVNYSHLSGANSVWHEVVVAHSWVRGQTFFYVDGALAGMLSERLTPIGFVLGGRGSAVNRPISPEQADYQNLFVHRSMLNFEEVRAQYQGNLQQASLELYAPLDDDSFTAGTAVINRAQSLSTAVVGGK